MENLWKHLNLDNYNPVVTPPEVILNQQCGYISDATDGKVIAKVAKYNGPMSDYMETRGPIGVINRLERPVDIQTKLGDTGQVPDMYFTHEFYLTSPNTPKYKFRIMFFRYALGQYPVRVILNYDIASDIMETEEVLCQSEDDFKALLVSISRSKKLKSVIIALRNIAQQSGEITEVAT